MSNTPIQVSYSLEEALARIEKKIDERFQETNQKFQETNQKIDTLQKDVTDLKIEVVGVKGDIKALNEKITGLGKRLENQEFVNRGILVALVVAILGSAAKLLGWVGNP